MAAPQPSDYSALAAAANPKSDSQQIQEQPQESAVIDAALALTAVAEAASQPHIVREFDAESKEVKDRWSRYIGAMGIEAVRRQTNSTVLVLGLDALGAEIAKNVVLSGVKSLTVGDNTSTTVSFL